MPFAFEPRKDQTLSADDSHLIEVMTRREELFRGRFLHAFRDAVRLPDGSASDREYLVHPGAVMVIPLLFDEDGSVRLVLERQYRYPIGEVMVEFPAGKLDPGEDRLACARRQRFRIRSDVRGGRRAQDVRRNGACREVCDLAPDARVRGFSGSDAGSFKARQCG